MCSPPDEYRDPGTPRPAHESERPVRADDGAALRLFTAEPPQGFRAGTVLIVHDVWGYTDFYKDLARRIAAEGYAGVLVDLFARQGELPEELRAPERTPFGADGLARARARSEQLSDERALTDIQLTLDDLHARGAPGVVCWGFCWGGRVAYVAGARSSRLAG